MSDKCPICGQTMFKKGETDTEWILACPNTNHENEFDSPGFVISLDPKPKEKIRN